MDPERVFIFDTTLRDGAQSEGISFSIEDKLDILQKLDEFGIDFVEGGWPGSNPKETEFFERASDIDLSQSRLVSFGRTRKGDIAPEEDSNLRSIVECGTGWTCIFGKAWDLQVTEALRLPLSENLAMVEESVKYLVDHGLHVLFDAEHFFDGWKENSSYTLEVLEKAADGGASMVVLCDTNGGTTPGEVREVIREVKEDLDLPLGIHAHNDSELAVANSLAAMEEGVTMVQGTVNGLGERCGNANLTSIMPNLTLKMGKDIGPVDLSRLTSLSRFVAEVSNVSLDSRVPFVGRSSFAHKGGVHVSAMTRDTRTYEHIDPSSVGNRRRILVSELSGLSNIRAKAEELGLDVKADRETLERLKELESRGFQFESAEASFELLLRRLQGDYEPRFDIEGFRVFVDVSGEDFSSDASIKVLDPSGIIEHTAADGNGPVNALDRALRKALEKFYPALRDVRLTDYKVRVIDAKDGTAAKVRVLIRSTDGSSSWTTVGVSTNIIEASLMALVDSLEYVLMQKAPVEGSGQSSVYTRE